MNNDHPWKRFFDAHVSVYDDFGYTKNTVAEVTFLIEELGLSDGAAVLDVGCGTGRHSIEFAKRGYEMTGIDISTGMLAKAREKAAAAGVNVRWLQADATDFSLDEPFDAAICLCEGSFGLLEVCDDPIEHPLAILRNINRSLKPSAKALLTVGNACRGIRSHTQDDIAAGRFEPETLSEITDSVPVPGHPPIRARERAFVATELALLFRLAGMTLLNVWGGTAGNWGKRKINLDETEIMAVAQKRSGPNQERANE